MGDGIETTRTAVADGVRVDKTIDTGPDDAAVVTLGVALERDEPTTVRITEPSLGDFPRDQIELHTDHGAEHWQVGETATFEREFDAGESYDVVYRVTDVDADRFEALDADPVVERVGASVDDLVDRDDSEAVRELIAGERESLAAPAPGAGGVELSLESGDGDAEGPASEPGTEPATAASGGPAADSSPEEISVDASPEELSVDVPDVDEPADEAGADPTGEPAAEADAVTETDEAGSEPADEPAVDPDHAPADAADQGRDDLDASLAATPKGGLARVLLQELREGHVDDETREALRAELEPGRSQDVRIKHLQSEVAEFAAYVEMLDGFVDEHGTLDAVVGGMDEQVASLDEAVESVRSELDDLSESVSEDVDDVEEDVAAVEEDVGAIEDDVDDVRDGQDDLEARVDELAEQLETVDERLDELDEFKERLSGAFQGVGEPES